MYPLQETVCCKNSRNEREPGIFFGGAAGTITGENNIWILTTEMVISFRSVGYVQIRTPGNHFFPLPHGSGIRRLARMPVLLQGKPDAGHRYPVFLYERPEKPDEADAEYRSAYPEPPHRPERAFFGKIIPVRIRLAFFQQPIHPGYRHGRGPYVLFPVFKKTCRQRSAVQMMRAGGIRAAPGLHQ